MGMGPKRECRMPSKMHKIATKASAFVFLSGSSCSTKMLEFQHCYFFSGVNRCYWYPSGRWGWAIGKRRFAANLLENNDKNP